MEAMDFFGNGSTTIQDLNMDCWRAVLECLDITDIARSGGVSRGWRDMVHQYLQEVHGYIIFMPDSVIQIADQKSRVLNVSGTRMLVAMLRNIGCDMTRITTNGDKHWLSAIAENCPNLREVTLYNVRDHSNTELETLLRSCTLLEKVFIRASKWVEDNFTLYLNKIKHIEVDRNEHITGTFLLYVPSSQLKSLSLRECAMLQYNHLENNIGKLTALTKLALDDLSGLLEHVHNLIDKLPRLEQLSLSYYTEGCAAELAESISRLKDLKKLKVRKNGAVNDEFLEKVTQGCGKLEALDVAGCNGFGYNTGVTNASMPAIANCRLQHLDVSAVGGLSDAGLRSLLSGPGLQLLTLHVGQNGALAEETFFRCVQRFPNLQLLDVRGNEVASQRLVRCAARIVRPRSQPLTLLAAATSIQEHELTLLDNLMVRLDWPLDEPWERHYHNTDDQFEELESYANLNFEQPWQYGINSDVLY